MRKLSPRSVAIGNIPARSKSVVKPSREDFFFYICMFLVEDNGEGSVGR